MDPEDGKAYKAELSVDLKKPAIGDPHQQPRGVLVA